MSRTFLDVLSHFKCQNDKNSIEFVKYVMKKYFDEKRIFMPIEEAVPYLDKDDKELFYTIMEGVWRN